MTKVHSELLNHIQQVSQQCRGHDVPIKWLKANSGCHIVTGRALVKQTDHHYIHQIARVSYCCQRKTGNDPLRNSHRWKETTYLPREQKCGGGFVFGKDRITGSSVSAETHAHSRNLTSSCSPDTLPQPWDFDPFKTVRKSHMQKGTGKNRAGTLKRRTGWYFAYRRSHHRHCSHCEFPSRCPAGVTMDQADTTESGKLRSILSAHSSK